ncbi:hypothetical protein NDU88_002966 [Pleurodeles waltl]|uniref:Uncharacterized protein n=1 Tax=Pleurodeles waltl TaxID=8319 RepID=A0AAV7W0T5_PLEWA|nr:hypothetical protein NDU88_002966 [Pleurodeles waltl]
MSQARVLKPSHLFTETWKDDGNAHSVLMRIVHKMVTGLRLPLLMLEFPRITRDAILTLPGQEGRPHRCETFRCNRGRRAGGGKSQGLGFPCFLFKNLESTGICKPPGLQSRTEIETVDETVTKPQ